ncbi:MAG TPA: 3'(2'),5'-bisphosphate nucleotidase CysQ [Nitrosopumilaceae archaeon]|nr:3'(2'),5'-bisphosphate nucleotidase CysQ [Nitrosopumilaceae archaeon]
MQQAWDIPEKMKSSLPEFEIALKAAVKAGNEIIKVYSSDFASTTKKDNSPITIADLKSNKIIKEILSETGITILSEEDLDDKKRLDEKKVWIIDPLDGTTDFIKRTGEFTVMISLAEAGKPLLGVIYWPTENTVFAAQRKCGAWMFANNSWKQIFVSKISDLRKCRGVGSRYHISDIDKNLLEKLYLRDFTSVGSSLKVAKISSGDAEVYFTTTDKIKEWDTCASYSIISEAGGKMTDMYGKDLSYNNKEVHHKNGILVTNSLVHNEIINEFKKL